MLRSANKPLRSAYTAHSRATVLACLLERQANETTGQISPDRQGSGSILLEDITVRERELLRAPPGSWDAETVEQVSWNREALGVLGWTLGWLDRIPPYDTGFRREDVLEAFSAGCQISEIAYARPEYAIREARDLAEAWHWRIRTKVLEDQILEQGMDPVEVVREAAQYLHEHTGLVIVDGDYSTYGKPFRDLTIEEFDCITNVAFQRHRTLNWLCGLTRNWDDASLDT